LRPSEFRKVYDEGFRSSNRLFSAFCWKAPEGSGPRIGLTVPKAVGRAVCRNRIKRRLREVLRRRLTNIRPQWWIVFNPRRAAAEVPFTELEREVDRLIERCASR
jgi:ribonuclease P protein component